MPGGVFVNINSVALQTGEGLVFRGISPLYNWVIGDYYWEFDRRFGDEHLIGQLLAGIQPDKVVFGFQGNAIIFNPDGTLAEQGGVYWRSRCAYTLGVIAEDILDWVDPEDVFWLHDYQVGPHPNGINDDFSRKWVSALNWLSQDYQVDTFPLLYPDFNYVTFGAAKTWWNPIYRLPDQIHLSDTGKLYVADRVIAAALAAPDPIPEPPPTPDPPDPNTDPDLEPEEGGVGGGVGGGPGGGVAGGALGPRVRTVVSGRFRKWLTQSHEIVARVDVRRKDLPQVIRTLDLVDGSVTISAADTLQRSGSLTAVDPDGTLGEGEAATILDPRNCELQVWMGPRYPDGNIEFVPVALLMVDNLDFGTDGTYLLECYDRSKRVQDEELGDPYVIESGTPVEIAARDLLLSTLGTLPISFPATGDVCPTLILDAKSNAWDEAAKLFLSSGYRLMIDPTGTAVADPVRVSAAPVAAWSFRDDGRSVAWDVRRQPQGARPNRVIVKSKNSAFPGIRGVAEDRDPTSPTFVGRLRITETIEDERVTTQEQADRAAAARLARRLGASELITASTWANPAFALDETAAVEREELGLDDLALMDRIVLAMRADQRSQVQFRRSVLLDTEGV